MPLFDQYSVLFTTRSTLGSCHFSSSSLHRQRLVSWGSAGRCPWLNSGDNFDLDTRSHDPLLLCLTLQIRMQMKVKFLYKLNFKRGKGLYLTDDKAMAK